MDFAVEEAQGRGYKRVHRAGCGDLIDPEPVGAAEHPEELLALLSGYAVADDLDELSRSLAPCARQKGPRLATTDEFLIMHLIEHHDFEDRREVLADVGQFLIDYPHISTSDHLDHIHDLACNGEPCQ